MNVVFLSTNDWGGTNFRLASALNRYTSTFQCRSITQSEHPFQYNTDIVVDHADTPEDQAIIEKIIDQADFFCIAQNIPQTLVSQVVSRLRVNNHFVRHSGSDVRYDADALFMHQMNKTYYWSLTAYDNTMTRCLIQSLQHNTHVLETNRWKPDKNLSKRKGPVIIYHSPTNNDYKGTDYITRAIQVLKEDYPIEWIHTGCTPHGHGGIPWEQVMEQKGRADIFIDAMNDEAHGQNAIEAMCFGIPVITGLGPYYKAIYPDTPLLSATSDTIESVLEDLIVNKKKRLAIGKATRAYCERMFSMERAATVYSHLIHFIASPSVKTKHKPPRYWETQICSM